MGRRGAIAWALAAAAALASCATFACSLLVDQGAAQCVTSADCIRFTGTQCLQGACATVTIAFDAAIDSTQPCTSTQDCLTLHGSNWVCRSTRCQSLGSDDCGIVIGNYTADDVLLLGAILPIYGAHKSTGLPMERALAFAAEQDFSAGVPFGLGGVKRPVAIVLCNESDDPVKAAKHLAEDIGVPAILGPAFGSSYLAVAENVAIPDHVLLMSPYATADLSSLASAGSDAGATRLAWRTAPDSAGEAAAMADVAASVLEPRVAAAQAIPRVAMSVVWRGDADGTSLHGSLVASLTLNGFPAAAPVNAGLFTDFSYGDTDSPGEEAATFVTGTSPPPNVIAVIGRTEAVSEIIKGIENVWPESTPLPYYVVSHGLQVEELLSLVTLLPSLRGRVLSTSAGDNLQSNAALRGLLARYTNVYTDYPSQTFGVAQTYDAYYALAFGLAAIRNTDIVGLDERDGLEKILLGSGTPRAVTVGPAEIDSAFAAIEGADAGDTISLSGTSGSLRFGAAPYTPASDVQVFCIVAAQGTGVPVFMPAGLAWRASTGALAGSLASTCLE